MTSQKRRQPLVRICFDQMNSWAAPAIGALILLAAPAYAQDSAASEASGANTPSDRAQRVSLSARDAVRVNYGRKEWNRDPLKIESATLFMREGDTGRVVQIELEEIAPDASVFSGIYSISFRDLEGIRVEFYAPKWVDMNSEAARLKFVQKVSQGGVRRNPFVMRRDRTGLQNIEVFDTADQARSAFRAYQSEQQLLIALQNRLEKKDQVLDTAELAMEKAELEAASKNLAERVRLGQLETQRLAELTRAFLALTPPERAQRKQRSQELQTQALAEYRAERYPNAVELFGQAIELEPTDRSNFFQYGVARYKIEQFNRAVVYLELAEGPSVNPIERDFYKGLCFYRLRDSISAISAFQDVEKTNDPTLSPSASFYRGMIFFERKRWSEAKDAFQAVLDKSSDPKLDERAEGFIEQILRLQQFEAERARRWILTGTIGEQFDDNVILSSDSARDQGSATDAIGYRTLLVGSARYRPIYEADREFAAQLDVLTMYTVDKSFQRAQALTNSDPTIIGLTLPWTRKGLLRGKGHKMDIIPGYETTIMSIENNQSKSILNSYILNFQNLLVINETWFTNINLDLRQDNSTLTSSTGDNDATALKAKLSWANINFPFEDKKKLLMTDVGYTINNAKGKNVFFNRLDLGIGHVRPFYWNSNLNLKLAYYQLAYSQNSNARVDNDIALTLGFSKKVSEQLTGGWTTTYTINNSNVSANQYKKITSMLTLTMQSAF
jgi:tetratricopeptide (TPR) repeat protein